MAKTAATFPLRVCGITASQILGAVNLGGIFDDLEMILFCNRQNRIHVHGVSVDVDRHDGFKFPVALIDFHFNFFKNLRHVHAPGSGIAIHEDRNAAVVEDCLHAGDDRKSGHDDLVARMQANTSDGSLKGSRTITHGNTVFHAAVIGPFLLEFFDEAACRRYPAGAKTLVDVFDLLCADQGFTDWNHEHSSSNLVLSPSPV